METVKKTVYVTKPGGEPAPLKLTFKIPSLAELQAAPNQPTPHASVEGLSASGVAPGHRAGSALVGRGSRVDD